MAGDSSTVYQRLRQTATRIRRRNLQMIHQAGGVHIGGDLSATDILTALYFGGVLRVDPENPAWPDRDRFFLSKGHCDGVFYTTLAEAGFFPEEELNTFSQPLSHLNGHPQPRRAGGRGEHRRAGSRDADRGRRGPGGENG